MKAASLAALALAGLLATTAITAKERAVTDEPSQERDAQRLPNDSHGYENSNPNASSPDPRLDERDTEDRREHATDRPESDVDKPYQQR